MDGFGLAPSLTHGGIAIVSDPRKSFAKIRFQYTLGTFLTVVLVFSLACSYLAVELRAARTQASAIALLRQSEFQVFYEDQLDEQGGCFGDGDWRRFDLLCRLFGDDFVARVTKVEAPLSCIGSFKIVCYSNADDRSIAPCETCGTYVMST